MVINHLEKLFVTNDAATVLRELEVRYKASLLYFYTLVFFYKELSVSIFRSNGRL